ncbi:response regulator [Pedobacter ureilyticus]|uniref:Response regulator n=2 Tax=Pedobacter ureilyticus TaxID=1393051 RepID=A0ABW9J7H5_9SPHI
MFARKLSVFSGMQENLIKDAKTIAVFDDDQDLLDIFRFLLEEVGHKVVLFNNCDDIVSKVRDVNPVLILMDNWIPLIGGEQAIGQIRNEEDLKHIPVILVSASNDIAEVAKRAGADGVIAKPFDFDVILSMINKLIG